jgi:tRNA-splicing ligase RtcB
MRRKHLERVRRIGAALPETSDRRAMRAPIFVVDTKFDAFLAQFRVVTPVEPQQIRERPDIRANWRAALKEEAPFAYKVIGPVIATLRQAEVAEPAVELHPILTVKG